MRWAEGEAGDLITPAYVMGACLLMIAGPLSKQLCYLAGWCLAADGALQRVRPRENRLNAFNLLHIDHPSSWRHSPAKCPRVDSTDSLVDNTQLPAM